VPFPVELVFPERAFGVIREMVFFAVNAFEGVWAWFTFLCFESGGICFIVPFTTPSQVSVVFEFVGASTLLAFSPVHSASKHCVFPFPAVVALGNAWVYGGASDRGDVPTKVEGPVYDGFGFGPILRVPDVNPDDCHVRVFRSSDDSRARRKGDVIEHARLREGVFNL